MDYSYINIDSLDALSEKLSAIDSRLAGLSAYAKPTQRFLSPAQSLEFADQRFEFQSGRHHALISIGVHNGVPLIQYCSVSDQPISPPEKFKEWSYNFYEKLKTEKPFEACYVNTTFNEDKHVAYQAAYATWMQASVNDRPANPPKMEVPDKQRLDEGKQKVETSIAEHAALYKIAQPAMPKAEVEPTTPRPGQR